MEPLGRGPDAEPDAVPDMVPDAEPDADWFWGQVQYQNPNPDMVSDTALDANWYRVRVRVPLSVLVRDPAVGPVI